MSMSRGARLTLSLTVATLWLLHAATGLDIRPFCKNTTCYCERGTVACTSQFKFRELPSRLPAGTTKLIMHNIQFEGRQELRPQDLVGLERLNILKIIRSNLRAIRPQTFERMTELKELDLSSNRISHLEADVFSGLDLSDLQLSEQGGLTFDENAFRGLKAEQIKLTKNRISHLEPMVFSRVRGLKSLHLFSNDIRTVPVEFKAMFDTKDSILDLTGNPLICSCDLNWLANRADDLIKKSKGINITCSFMEHTRYGKQTGGQELKLSLADLASDQMCHRAEIEGIDVELTEDGELVNIICRAASKHNLGSKIMSRHQHVAWDRLLNLQEPNISWVNMSSGVFVKQSGVQAMGDHKAKRQLTIKMGDRAREFVCEASGQANTKPHYLQFSLKGFKPVPVKSIHATPQSKESSAPDLRVREPPEEYILFQEQFTLLEMFGAIAGTFLVTLVFLFAGSRCFYVMRQRKHNSHMSSSNSPMLLDQKMAAAQLLQERHHLAGSNGALVNVNGSNSSGGTVSVRNQFAAGQLGYPGVAPGTPGQYLAHVSAPSTAYIPDPMNTISKAGFSHLMLQQQQTPNLNGTLCQGGRLAPGNPGFWPPGSPHSNHEYDVPRHLSDLSAFEPRLK